MTAIYSGTIGLVDEHGFITTLHYDLGQEADTLGMAAKLASLNAIAAELVDVTSSNISGVKLSVEDTTNENFTVPTEAENSEEAVISVHLAASPLMQKLGQLRIPAPVNGLFLADKYTLDTSNVPLADYIAAVAANALVSDGETIVTARGIGGIAGGSWRSKAKRAPKKY